jgi:hypothetical protein
MTISDIGPKPQSFNLEEETVKNPDYRTVAWSGRYLQLTLMSIPEGGDIGLEAHLATDRFLRLDAGRGRVQMGPTRDNLEFEQEGRTDGASSCRQVPGTTSPTSATSPCSCTRSTRPSTTNLARFM